MKCSQHNTEPFHSVGDRRLHADSFGNKLQVQGLVVFSARFELGILSLLLYHVQFLVLFTVCVLCNNQA